MVDGLTFLLRREGGDHALFSNQLRTEVARPSGLTATDLFQRVRDP